MKKKTVLGVCSYGLNSSIVWLEEARRTSIVKSMRSGVNGHDKVTWICNAAAEVPVESMSHFCNNYLLLPLCSGTFLRPCNHSIWRKLETRKDRLKDIRVPPFYDEWLLIVVSSLGIAIFSLFRKNSIAPQSVCQIPFSIQTATRLGFSLPRQIEKNRTKEFSWNETFFT